MKSDPRIDHEVFLVIQRYLAQIEAEHNVVIIQAIESGSRAWGFPSPDSDYDVRFVYAHAIDWYLQLVEEKDVIEIPISDELDIAGWDLRKSLRLANKGNAVIQEWMNSPIIYKQSSRFNELFDLVGSAFNPTNAYHHYRSMAKKAFTDIQSSETKKLKRFFYFARATLSAKWILVKGTTPSILFSELVAELVLERSIVLSIESLVLQKASELEASTLQVPSNVYRVFTEMYDSLEEGQQLNSKENRFISNKDFSSFLYNSSNQ